jgi:putative membrane protein
MSLSHTSPLLTILILGLSTAAPAPPAPVQQPMDDAAALGIFEAVAGYDIETSGLAVKKATDADVKQLASTFEHDHKALLQKTKEEAKKLNIKAKKPKEAPLAAEHADAMQRLKAAKGEEFERTWIANEVRYHNDAVKFLNDSLVPAIQSPELKSFVKSAVPAFQGHLAASQKLALKYHVT